ncbi:MAG: PAS domain S-box protein [Euryarchaeota archaeon]|nr:PAS domain S-box protein [Euryarchaeota archaeon]
MASKDGAGEGDARKESEAPGRTAQRLRLLETIIETSPDAITLIGLDMKIIMANRTGAKHLGYGTPDELVGMDATELIAPGDHPRMLDALQGIFEAKIIRGIEFNLLRKDGSTVPIEFSGSLVCDEKDEPLYLLSVSRDVSERKKTESLLRSIADNMLDVVCKVDAQGDILFVSPSVERVLGYTPQEMARKPFREYMHADDLEKMNKLVEVVARSGGVDRAEFRMMNAKGEYVWIEALGTLAISPSGEVAGAIFGMRDITEQKRADQALLESEERLRGMISSMNDLIFMLDENGRFNYYHSLEDSRLYVPPSAFMGKRFDEVLPPYMMEKMNDAVSANRGGKVAEIEYWMKIGNDMRWFSAKLSPIMRDGVYRGSVAVVRDITERKTSWEALSQSEEKYRNLVERANDAIAILQDGRVAFANRQVERLIGQGHMDIIGRPFTDFVPEEVKADLFERYRLRIEGKDKDLPTIYETRILRADGTEVPVEVNAGAVDYQGKPADLIFVRDLSERERADELIRKSETLSRAVIDSSPVGITLRDKDGELLMYNTVWKDIWALSEKSIRERIRQSAGKPFEEIYPYLEPWFKEVKKVWTVGGEYFIPEVQIRDIGAGREKTVSLFFYGILGTGGKLEQIVTLTQDITERKEAAARLAEMQRLNENVVSNAPIGIMTTDMEGGITSVNNAMLSILGSPGADSTMKFNVLKLKAMVDQGVSALFEKCLKEGGEIRLDRIGYKTNWGKSIVVTLMIVPLRDAGGGQIGSLALIEDIMGMARAEEQLNALFQASIDGIGVEKDDKLVFVNPSFAKIFGYDSPEELIGRPTEVTIAPEDRDRVASYTVLRSSGRERRAPQRYDFRGLRKDSSTFAARISVSTYTIGEERYFVGFVHDVTETRRAETMLRLSEEQYHLTIDAMNDAIHMVDSGLRVMLANKAMKQWNKRLGLETDIVGKDVFEVFPYLPEKVRYEYEQVFDTGRALVTEESTTIGDAEVITETRKVPVIEGGKAVRVVTVVRDITVQKRRQEEQLRRRMLEAQYELKSVITDIIPLFLETLEPGKREEMIVRLSERLDEVIAERYSKAIHLTGAREAATAYIGVLFDLGGTARHESHGASSTLVRVTTCPWDNQKHRNFMLCILCRAMAWRFAHYAGEDLAVRMAKTMADGEPECEIQVGTRRALGVKGEPDEERPKKGKKKK